MLLFYVNTYALDTGASENVEQTLVDTKGEIDSNTEWGTLTPIDIGASIVQTKSTRKPRA